MMGDPRHFYGCNRNAKEMNFMSLKGNKHFPPSEKSSCVICENVTKLRIESGGSTVAEEANLIFKVFFTKFEIRSKNWLISFIPLPGY